MDICLMSFTQYFSRSELISIAGIHATLLAIITASLSAYCLLIFGNIQTFQLRAINEAEKINEIEFLLYQHGLLDITQDDLWC